MACIPQETLFATSTSVNDVHGDESNSAKTSEEGSDDRTAKDSFHHGCQSPFMMDLKGEYTSIYIYTSAKCTEMYIIRRKCG